MIFDSELVVFQYCLMVFDVVLRVAVAAGLLHYYLVERKKWRGDEGG